MKKIDRRPAILERTHTLFKLLLMVKCIVLLLLVGTLQSVASESLAQDKISISLQHTTLKEVFKIMEEKTSARFVYNDNILAGQKNINLNFTSVSWKDILKSILENTTIRYQILENNLVVLTDPSDKQVVIKGKVVDNQNLGIPGVSVMERGTKTATVTNDKGEFSIGVTNASSVLQFSYVGYIKQEVPVSTSFMTVVLKDDASTLDDVVVVGYGKQDKKSLTGSVVSITGSTFSNIPVSNISNALSGRMAGLVVSSPSSLPGVSSSMNVRGITSFSGQDPLYVIDDIPRTKQEFDLISPNDVASISVLKDGAAAIYGVRGGSGVILITTKQGKSGTPQFNFNISHGISDPTRVPERLSSYENVLYRNNYYLNQGVPANDPRYYSADEIAYYQSGAVNTDVFDMISQTPRTTNANLSVSGGSENSKYYVATGYLKETGLYDNLESERFNLLTNLDFNFGNGFSAKVNVQGTFRTNTTPWWYDGVNTTTLSDLTRAAMNYTPLTPAYINGLPDGTVYHLLVPEIIENGYMKGERTNLNGLLKLSYNPTYFKGFGVDVSYNYNKQIDVYKTRYQPYTLYVFNRFGGNNHLIGDQVVGTRLAAQQPYDYYQEQFSQGATYVFNASAHYDKVFGKHNLSAQLFYEQSEFSANNFSAKGEQLLSSTNDQLILASTDPNRTSITGSNTQLGQNGVYLPETGRASVFGRINYSYGGKYMFSGILRADASSAFAPQNKWGYFPSVSAGWVLSEESFIKDKATKIDNLKLRAGYGILGYDNINLSQWYNYFAVQTTSAVFGTPTNTIAPSVYANPDITWQKIATTNVGLDASFYRGLLSGTLDLYYKKTSNILVANPTTVPYTFGSGVAQINYGRVDAKGIELTLRHDNNIGNVKYFVGFNFAYNTNKVIDYPEQDGLQDYLVRTGRPVNFTTGYISTGLIRNADDLANYLGVLYGTRAFELGDIGFSDVSSANNGAADGVVNANDNSVLSLLSYDPRINYGIPFGASWKGFDINVLLQGVGARQVMISDRSQWQEQNVLSFWSDFWSSENPDAAYPKIGGLNGTQTPASSFWMRSGAYLRFKSLELGYTLNPKVSKKIGVDKCRFFLTGTNLFLLSDDIKIYDPELPTNETGYGAFQYPIMRTVSIGANISF